MSELRQCRNCGKMYDPAEPWTDHDTMEESAWKDIQHRMAIDSVIDSAVEQAARELK